MNFDLNIPMDEEQDYTNNPHEINSFDVEKVLQANIIYVKKKRKFQTEQMDLPLLKHKFRDRNLHSALDSPSEETPIQNDFEIYILKEKDVSETTNDKSVKDSNSTCGNNMDSSSESVFNKERTISDISISNSDTSVTLSASNYGSFRNDPFSLEARSKSPKSAGDCSYSKNDYGPDECLDCDESLLEFGCGESSDTEQCKDKEIEDIKDKEIEDMLYSNGMPPDYVLSSGKWSFNQEKQGGSKKLTIDKEFEEYFSMLML